MAQGAIDHRAPKDHKHDHRAEFHPFGKRPANQGRRDDEKHALKEHVRQSGMVRSWMQRRHRFAIDPLGLNAFHEQVIEIADPFGRRC